MIIAKSTDADRVAERTIERCFIKEKIMLRVTLAFSTNCARRYEGALASE